MNQLEENITKSFRKAKSDILTLQNAITQLHQNQESLMAWIQDTRDKEAELYQRIKSPKAKKMPNGYIASKKGKKVHVRNCPYGKKVTFATQVLFDAKQDAFQQGYRSCACMES